MTVVARALREEQDNASVGLYAYSSHRMPPTIAVEPNVYVQVAMGFNKTPYSLPELIDRWSQKVQAIGLREYYGVEAWDWGLPGRMRGGQIDYHRRWIPYYVERNVNAINAETNANWGGQTLGLYVASQLMWQPTANVDALTTEFFELCFGDVAGPMRECYQLLAAAPPLRSATLLPILERLAEARRETRQPDVQARLTDLMAYMVYVCEFRKFDLTRSRQPTRNDEYYAALKSLMEYAWQIRHRDMVHYYALARRLCNGLPLQDNRPDFYLASRDREPVWRHGESLTDAEIDARFQSALEELRNDDDPTIAFSRMLNRVRPPGADAGPSGIVAVEQTSVARFRGELVGYLIATAPEKIQLGVSPTSRSVEVRISDPAGNVIYDAILKRPVKQPLAQSATPIDGGAAVQVVSVDLPRANEYRVELKGEFTLHVPRETAFVYEASVMQPAWIDYSGPHYFYVPRGTQELVVDADPRLSLHVPGVAARLDVTPADRPEGKHYLIVPVPKGADGQVWHTSNMTRGKVSFLNVPPLLSLHRDSIFVPREVAESDGLTTQ